MLHRALLRTARAGYATTPSQTKVLTFDRAARLRHLDLGARHPDAEHVQYVRQFAAETLADRLLDIKREFPRLLELGSGPGFLEPLIDRHVCPAEFIQVESAAEWAAAKHLQPPSEIDPEDRIPRVQQVIGDETAPLDLFPHEQNTFDAILSSLSLHWANDLPRTLAECEKLLKPDGAFLGAVLGGDTLYELRSSLQLANMERHGRMLHHTSPLTTIRDLGTLLNNAGFKLLTLDQDEMTVRYPSVFELMEDLKLMGENNATFVRPPMLSRDALLATDAIYKAVYGGGEEGIPATFHIYYMIGWKYSPDQPLPKERGSATVSMQAINDLDSVDPARAKPKGEGKNALDELFERQGACGSLGGMRITEEATGKPVPQGRRPPRKDDDRD